LPAHYEPFGLSALEAALSGCALALGDTESLREIWDDAALFVRPDDPEHILVSLLELIANSSLREDFSRRSQRRARLLTTERMAQGYMDLYAKLLRAQRRPVSEDFNNSEYSS
jgi:glycosyltransferase involved in cell wall biosynthesis